MTIYDVLRKIISGEQWADFQRAEALRLIDDLERLAVLGYVAGTTSEGHAHQWISLTTGPGRAGMLGKTRRCSICQLEE